MKVDSHPIFGGKLADLGGTERFFVTADNGSRAILIGSSSVRWCNNDDQNYNYMPLIPVFDGIRHGKVSKGGEYVCLYNDDEFRVIEIPWGYKDTSKMARAFQRCRYQVCDGEAKIKQILFHPLGYKQETLVILKDDDSVTIENWKDLEGAKQTVLNTSNGTYSLDSYITDIESMAFSSDGITLYALSVSEGSDIYAFYPCLPTTLDCSESLLDAMMYKSLIQYEELNTETDSEVKKNTIKQLQFVSKLRETHSSGKQLTVSLDLRQARGQGPFTIAPFPEQMYNCTGRSVGVMPIDDTNELLLMSLDDGSVAIMLQDLEPTMNWNSVGYNFNTSLTLIELVKLETGDVKEIVVEKSLHGLFFVRAAHGVYSIDTTQWSSTLAKSLEDSDLRPLGEINFKSKVTFQRFSGVSNTLALWRTNSDACIASVTATEVLAGPVPNDLKGTKEASSASSKRLDEKNYNAAYSQPIEEITNLNQRFQKELAKPPSQIIKPQDRQAPLKNDSNEVQLDLLTEYSKELFQKIAIGQSLGATLHNRLAEQVSDLCGQLKTSGELIQKQQDMKEILEFQTTKFGDLETRSTKLNSRFNKLKENLAKISESTKFKELSINKQELAWFREIKNQVLMFNQNVRNQQKLQEQLAFLRRELTRISTQGTDGDTKSREEWQELRSMLEEDTKILQECNHQLNLASRQVPANL